MKKCVNIRSTIWKNYALHQRIQTIIAQNQIVLLCRVFLTWLKYIWHVRAGQWVSAYATFKLVVHCQDLSWLHLLLPALCEAHTCFSFQVPVSIPLWARNWTDSLWTATLPGLTSYTILLSIPSISASGTMRNVMSNFGYAEQFFIVSLL